MVSHYIWKSEKNVMMSYSGVQLRRDTYLRGKMFLLFSPSFQRFSGTNDTSFESPNIGRSEFTKKKWPWHHFEAGYAPLTEKALLLLELVWNLS